MALHLPRRWGRPRLETLEARWLPTNYVVTSTLDMLNHVVPGEVTLRDVLTAINTQAPSGNAPAGTASNTIRFALGTIGTVQTIQVGSGNVAGPLPALVHQVFLDGWSQGGANYSGRPLVVLNGVAAGGGAQANGLKLAAGSQGSTIRGLVIQQFGNHGIEIEGSSQNQIVGNYIGLDADGVTVRGNGNSGIVLHGGAQNNVIGGRTPALGNVLSGNGNPEIPTGHGVVIAGVGTTGNLVQGNRIGTDHSGMVAIGNALGGIVVTAGATSNTIGGTAPGSANVVVGSGLPNIAPPEEISAVLTLGQGTLSGSVMRFDVVISFADVPPAEMVYLGIDVRKSSPELAPFHPALGGQDYSAFDFFPSSTLGPGWAPIENAFPGQFLYETPPPPGTERASGLPANGTYLVGTLTYDLGKFGLQPSALLSLSIAGDDTTVGAEEPDDPSTFHFVDLSFAPGEQTFVPAPAQAGVEISGAGTNNNVLEGNLIGVHAQGTGTLGQLNEGVRVQAGASGNRIAGNVLAGSDDGVVLSGPGTSRNLVQGNRIGTNAQGTANLGNTISGVLVEGGATANTIGGRGPGQGNLITFNGKGVILGSDPQDISTTSNAMLGNLIYGNSKLGIDLGNDGPTPNGANPRNFPNEGQNTPLLTTLTLRSVSGLLVSIPRTRFRIELFASPVGGLPGEGRLFLGAGVVTTSATGMTRFTLNVARLPLGMVVTATATNLTTFSTSEFSPVGTQLLVTSAPIVVASGRATKVTLTAQLYAPEGPITTGVVTFVIPGVSGAVTGRPNASGQITVSLVIPAKTPPGQYTIAARYPGEGDVPGTTGESSLTVTSLLGRGRRRWIR